MFKNFSLKAKLLSAFGGMALCLLGVGAASLYSLDTVSRNYEHVVKVNFGNAVTLATQRAAQKDIVIEASALAESSLSADEVKEFADRMNQAFEKRAKAAKTYEEIPFVEGEEALWKQVELNWAPFEAGSRKIVDLSRTGKSEDRKHRAAFYSGDYRQIRDNLMAALNKLLDFQEAESRKWEKVAEEGAKSGKTTAVLFVIIGFIAAGLIGFFFSSSLSKSLSQIAERLSMGAEEVASASKQIASSSEELSSSATEQAASLEQTASSVEQMSAMVSKNAENANRSRDISGESHQSAGRGKQVVTEMMTAIGEINRSNGDIMTQIETSNREISEIVKVIADIGNKTKVINDIVFQTKLLSFNASVEAARAGEHGKGFAVVAEEVGNLAQMSGNAAKEITAMLEGSIQKVERIVEETKTRVSALVEVGKQKVETGTKVASRCGEVLDEIVRSVSEVSERVGEISTSSQEQSQGIQEITRAVSQLDQVTQQNASASQEASAAAEELSSQAEVLRSMVRDLMSTVRGGSGGQDLSTGGHAIHAPKLAHSEHHAPLAQPSKKGGNVVALKTGTRHAPAPLKKAAGAEGIPSESDPRFKDV